MSRLVRAGLIAVSVLAAMSLAPGPSSNALTDVRLAVLPCVDIESTFNRFQPLLAHLRAVARVRVTLVVPDDLAEFEAALRNRQVDFALQDPHTFQQLAHLFDGESLLQTRAPDGTTRQAAVVVVRRDSGITDLGQLRGGTVMLGPRTSSPKWVAARLLFASRGFTVDRDVTMVNGGCCEDIAFAVTVRAVDAGVVCDHFLGDHQARQRDLGVDPGVLQVIGRTAPFPTRIFAARRGVNRQLVAAVDAGLLALDPAVPSQAAVMAKAEIGGFLRVSAAEYLAAWTAGGPAPRP